MSVAEVYLQAWCCDYADASKDFYDPGPPGRRILWGWVEFGQGVLSLPREVTYHPQLQQLVFTPVPELAKLRLEPLAGSPVRKATPLSANESVLLGCADTVEVKAVFSRPAHAARLGVYIGADRSRRSGYWYFVDYRPPPTPASSANNGVYNVTVGRTKLPVAPGRYKRVRWPTSPASVFPHPLSAPCLTSVAARVVPQF